METIEPTDFPTALPESDSAGATAVAAASTTVAGSDGSGTVAEPGSSDGTPPDEIAAVEDGLETTTILIALVGGFGSTAGPDSTHSGLATGLAKLSSLELLSAASIEAALTTGWVGRSLEFHSEIGSTNERLAHLARNGAPAGTLIIAELQTTGRGRLGRKWVAPAGDRTPAINPVSTGVAPGTSCLVDNANRSGRPGRHTKGDKSPNRVEMAQ